jgi:hypothetical protein
MTNDWTTTYCIHEEGFPKVLYATTVRLGIPGRPEYVGREYVEQGTKYCKFSRCFGIHIVRMTDHMQAFVQMNYENILNFKICSIVKL